ncbi:MAG: hypothetical protein NC413_04365 [Muribaculum sp.]|nr:hypothetical protein [Muribaculum sp.]
MKISGKLSLITKGLKNQKEVIGKPITVEGIVVGKIVEIDEEKNLYFGEISNNDLINFVTPSCEEV